MMKENQNRNHGCTVVQAVVMVTIVLIGNGHFWTGGNKKPQNQLSPNFAQVITLVYLIYLQIFLTIGSWGGFSAHAWNITLLSLFNALSFLPFPFFLAHVRRSNAWTNIDGWWLKRRVLTQGSAFWICEWWKITFRGSTAPKTVAFFNWFTDVWCF